MKEFVSILISYIFMSIADSVDSAFNNYLSIDAVVVCGSLVFIKFIAKSICEIGIYTYRITRNKSGSYLLISGVVGLILGIISFLFSDLITNLFDLTINQKEMLSGILKLYIIYLPISTLHIGLLEMVRLQNKLKLYRKGLIVTYISLILFDVLAFIFIKNLAALFVATILSDIICFIYLYYKTKLKFEKITKEELENVRVYGIPYSLERIFSRSLILAYGALASHLETEKYAIHTICYSVCLTLETITTAYQATLMIKAPEGKTYKEQYNICMEMKKKCFPLILLLNFTFAFIYLAISHGSVSIISCFPYFLLYITAVFGLYQYENYKTLCIVQCKSYILLIGSTVGALIRFLICLVFMNTPASLYVFGIATFIDFYSRSLVYRGVLYRLEKSNKLTF